MIAYGAPPIDKATVGIVKDFDFGWGAREQHCGHAGARFDIGKVGKLGRLRQQGIDPLSLAGALLAAIPAQAAELI